MDFKSVKMEAGRKAILDAADRSAREGKPIQIASVAEEAQIAVGTVYRYFEDKQRLEDELVARMFMEVAASAEKEINAADPVEGRLESLLRAICETTLDHPGALRVFLARSTWTQLGTDHDAPDHAKQAYDVYCELESDILRKLLQRGIPLDAARLFLRAALMSGLTRLVPLPEKDRRQGIDVIIRLTVHGLLECPQ